MLFHQKRCSRPVDGKIGVLALQGNVQEHIEAFEQVVKESGHRIEVVPVRRSDEIADLIALAIPGGESTTIMRLIDKNGLRNSLLSFKGGFFATCAGMVITAREVIGESRFEPLGVIDISVDRNAFGRQRESFEAELQVTGLTAPYHALFIRAPIVRSAGPGVEVLAEIPRGIVVVRSGKHLALSFHPELGGDLRLHRIFLDHLALESA